MEVEFSVFWFRLANVALCAFVFSMCVFKLAWKDPDKGRRARISALALLTIVAAWTAYDLRLSDFHPRIPITTLGLVLAAYGLSIMPTHEQVKNKLRRKSDTLPKGNPND